MGSKTLLCPVHIDGKWRFEPMVSDSNYPKYIQQSRVISPLSIKVTGTRDVIPGNEGNEFVRKFKFAKIDISKSFPFTDNIFKVLI